MNTFSKNIIVISLFGIMVAAAPAKAAPVDIVTFDFSSFQFTNSWTRSADNTSPVVNGVLGSNPTSRSMTGASEATGSFQGLRFSGSAGQLTSVSSFNYSLPGEINEGSYNYPGGSFAGTVTSGGSTSFPTGSYGTYNIGSNSLATLNFDFYLNGVARTLVWNGVSLSAQTPNQGGIGPQTIIARTGTVGVSNISAVPEIDGKVFPQVALLLVSMFFLFSLGRRYVNRIEKKDQSQLMQTGVALVY